MSTSVQATAVRHRPPAVNRVVLGLLKSALALLLDGRLCVLRYRTRGTQEIVEFPVQYARTGDRVVVVAGRPAGKNWWRHFLTPAPLEVRLTGAWSPGNARVLRGPERAAAVAEYRKRWRRTPVTTAEPVIAIDLRAAGAPPLRASDLTWSWFWIVTLAEFVGFTAPAIAGAVTASASSLVSASALLGAGAVEGAALGWGQAVVLRRALPAVSRRRWITATACAAVVAYATGLAPSVLTIDHWPGAAAATATAALGLVLLASLGTAQWPLLRPHLARASRWIPVTAVAWMLGLSVFLAFTMPLWNSGQPLALTMLIGVAGGLLMAATTSAITGYALARLLAGAR